MQLTTTLLNETHALLKDRPRSLTFGMIAEKTGLTVAWIRSFNEQTKNDYGCVRVETLNVFLKNYKG